jgi:hypothetical protein
MIRDAMSCREPQLPDDRTAKQLVQLCLPGVEVCLHDDGSQRMMCDLDLRWPDGHVEALEVTRATSAILRHVFHQIDRQGPVIARESTRDWSVWLAPATTDVRSVRAEIDHLLSLVEQAGIARFGAREERTSVAVARLCRQLGILYAFSREATREQPRIVLHPPTHAWWEQPEVVNQVVEDHAQRNAAKLAQSGRKERHLFVLFDLGEVEAFTALRGSETPEAPPQLPEAVTTAWAASHRADESPVLWRVRRTGRWEVLL